MKSPSKSTLLGGAATLIISLVVWWLAGQWYRTELIVEQQALSQSELTLLGNALALTINRPLTQLQGLTAFVQTEANRLDFQTKFDTFAAGLLVDSLGIRALVVAPDGLARYIFPLAGNEALQGQVLPVPVVMPNASELMLDQPQQTAADLTLTAWQPIYLEDGRYWGVAHIVLDLDTLLTAAGLAQDRCRLQCVLQDAQGRVLWGQADFPTDDAVRYQLDLPQQQWTLAMAPNAGWSQLVSRPLLIFQAAGLLVVVLVVALVYLTLGRQARLSHTIEVQSTALLEERRHLARELHDSVSQALYGIALGAQTARMLLDRDPSKLAEPLDYVLEQAEAGLTEMRALIFELRPEILEAEGLVVALTKRADALAARHNLTVKTSFCPEPTVGLAAKEALYRLAQEATHNIVKHAKASSVTITLTSDAALSLTITDNGRGFDPHQAFEGHLGLKSMRERVEGLGGRFQLISSPGQGTQIQAHLPHTA